MKVLIEVDTSVHCAQAAISICHALQSQEVDHFAIIDALGRLFTILEEDWDMASLAYENVEDARSLIEQLRTIADVMESGLAHA